MNHIPNDSNTDIWQSIAVGYTLDVGPQGMSVHWMVCEFFGVNHPKNLETIQCTLMPCDQTSNV